MRVFEHANYPFLSWRNRAYVISAVLILAGIASMVWNTVSRGSWLNYGVDFSGGTVVEVHFTRDVRVDELRSAASAAGEDWEINRFGSSNEFVVRMRAFEQQAGQDAATRVTQVLSQRFQPAEFEIERTEAVGPKVGNELQQRALLAILVSFAATLVYLWFRFEWRFGAAAILATAHDILLTLGYLAVTQSEVSLGTVAALLTIVGYSLNDTIVVFDRIRENLQKPRHGASYLEVLNRSVNETLPRTVLTGGGTLATLLALYFLGGPVIRDFALILILGIIIGTFSSLFVATPVLYEIEKRWPHLGKKSPLRGPAGSGGRSRAPSTV